MKHPALVAASSLQVLYRPVLQLPKLPTYPRAGANDPVSRASRQWWSEQLRRCRLGWVAPDGTFINPILYFALNFCKCQVKRPDTGKSALAPPFYRVTMKNRLDDIWRTRARAVPRGDDEEALLISARNLIEAKGRRAAWTTDTLEFYGLWLMLFDYDRPIGCLYPDPGNMPKERTALRAAFNRLPLAFKLRSTEDGVRTLRWVVDNKDRLTLGYDLLGKTARRRAARPAATTPLPGEAAGRFVELNTCRFALASFDEGPFKGDEFNAIFLVEVGKFIGNQLTLVFTNQKDCVEREGFRFGHFLIGGTSDMISNDSTDYRDMYYGATAYNAVSRFVSAAEVQGFNFYTGESKLSENLAKIMKKRADARATGKPENEQKEKQENPIHDYECFIPAGVNAYDRVALESQYTRLLREGYPEKHLVRGNLVWQKDIEGTLTGRVDFVEDKEQFLDISDKDLKGNTCGKFMLLRSHLKPRRYLKDGYFAAYDDVFKDFAPHSNSLASAVVWFRETYLEEESDLPVCYYLDRPPIHKLNEEILKLLVFFDCPVLAELHNTQFKKSLEDAGQEDRLIWIGRQPGIVVKEPQIVEMTRDGAMWMEEGGLSRVYFPRIIQALLRWRQGNDDVSSAFHIALSQRARLRSQAVRLEERTEVRLTPSDLRAKALGSRPPSSDRPAAPPSRQAMTALRQRVMGRSRLGPVLPGR